MLLQSVADLLHIDFGLGVAALHQLQLVGLLFEESENALLLLFVEALQLADDVDDQIAHFPQVLSLHIGQSGIGKVGHFLLGGCAVLQNLSGVLQIDLGSKIRDHFLLLLRQNGLLNGLSDRDGLFLYGQLLLFFQLGLQGQAGNGVHAFKFVAHSVLLILPVWCWKNHRLSGPPGQAGYAERKCHWKHPWPYPGRQNPAAFQRPGSECPV